MFADLLQYLLQLLFLLMASSRRKKPNWKNVFFNIYLYDLNCFRQIVVRGVVDTLQRVLDSRHEVERVFIGVVKLSNDSGNFVCVVHILINLFDC